MLASDPKFNKLMKRIGECLNLKKHCVGKNRVRLVGPGDIEGTLVSLNERKVMESKTEQRKRIIEK